jgi:CHAT domain-containing protein
MAIRIKVFGNNHPDVATSCNNIAAAYVYKKDYPKAISYFGRALALFRNYDERQNTIVCSYNIGLLYLKLKDYSKARDAFDSAIGVVEKARRETGSGKSEFMSRNIRAYYYSLSTSAIMNNIADAFSRSESMRSRGFLDRLSLNAALSAEGVSQADREKLLSLNDSIETLSAGRSDEIQKPSGRQNRDRLLSISKELDEKEKEFNSIDSRLMQNEKYRNLRKPKIATLADAREICGENRAILEYVIWEETDKNNIAYDTKQSYCIIITKAGAKIVKLDGMFDYTGNIMKYRESVIDEKKSSDRAKLGPVLYEKLIAPVEAELKGISNIVIVPDGALAFLPFDSLRKEKAGLYLCERYNISLSPSVSVMMMVRGRKYDASRNAMIAFGGAVYSNESGVSRGRRAFRRGNDVSILSKEYYAGKVSIDGLKGYYLNLGLKWDNLPGTADEVDSINSRVFGKKGTRIIKGKDVTEEKIKELSAQNKLKGYRAIHFATHGYYDQDFPSFSAVVFSDVSKGIKTKEDGYLSVEEAALLKLEADILNLSACETGLGRIVSGDGVIGLTRAFQVAGANSVGVTLWQVADDATRDFMIGVYTKKEKKGMSFGKAFNETKREFIKSKEFREPYFWSPFVLYGE